MNNEKCPCCPNACDKNNLSCERGRNYFNNSNSLEPQTINEMVINDLRKCGHILHHNKDLDSMDFLKSLSDSEINELHKILSKVCKDN